MSRRSSRRAFLRTASALAAGGAACAWAVPGAALTPLDGSDYGAVLQTACGGPDHRWLVEQTAAALGRPPGDPLVQAALRKTPCPSCGCTVAFAPAGQGDTAF